MNTNTLTPLQQKLSLSAKKNKKKRTVRNVLASPFVNYWPIIKPVDATSLAEILKEHLVKVKPSKVNVPWSKLKNIPRAERKEFRIKYSSSEEESVDKEYSSQVAFGANQATRLLETNTASSILISDHVNPKFLVKHILDIAVLHNVPILVVPNLNQILKEQTGIASIAMGLKITQDMAPNYAAVDKKIREMALDYPPPTDHINFHRRENVHDGDSSFKSPCLESPMDVNDSSSDASESSGNVYLYRKNKSERAFVPELSRRREALNLSSKMEISDSGFLAFNDLAPIDRVGHNKSTYCLNGKSKAKSKVSYKSLVVKRVIDNKDRDQKKIEMLKRKR